MNLKDIAKNKWFQIGAASGFSFVVGGCVGELLGSYLMARKYEEKKKPILSEAGR